jgi:hypothetical protein
MFILRTFFAFVFSYLIVSEVPAAEGQSSPIHVLEQCLGEIKSPSASLYQKQAAARKGAAMIGALMTPIYEEKGKEGKVARAPTIIPVRTSDPSLTHIQVLRLSETNATDYHKTLYMAIFMAAQLLEINLTQILTAAEALSGLKDDPRGARHWASCKSLAEAIEKKSAVNSYFNTNLDLSITGGATNFHAFFATMEGLLLPVRSAAALSADEASRKTNAIVEAVSQVSIYQRRGIEIPSDPNIVGVNVLPFANPNVQASWDALPSFTRQTLANFSRGNKRGFLLVHSLEDIMGVPGQFMHMWNLNHPGDQRHFSLKDGSGAPAFHATFTTDEIVEHYISYLSAYRDIISCSLLALNIAKEWSVNNTFAPLSFIFEVSSQNIVLASRSDAHTPVYYRKSAGENRDAQEYSSKERSGCITLDALIRYYSFAEINDKQTADMKQ